MEPGFMDRSGAGELQELLLDLKGAAELELTGSEDQRGGSAQRRAAGRRL